MSPPKPRALSATATPVSNRAARRPGADLAAVGETRPPKGGQLLARHLRQRIVSGELVEGSRLPVEAELMRHFQVSRTTLREALRILESESLVRVLRGSRSGPLVIRPDVRHSARYAGVIMQLEGATLADVQRARQTIEPAIARLVAQRPRREVVPALRAALAVEAAALQAGNQAYARAGSQFHELLIQLSGNTTLTVLAGTLNAIFERHTQAAHLAEAPDQHLNSLRAHRTHTRLVDLIEAGDAEGVEKLWAKHHAEAAKVIMLGHGDATIAELNIE